MDKNKEPNILTSIFTIIFLIFVIGMSVHTIGHFFVNNSGATIVGNTYVTSGGKDYLKIKSKSTLSIVNYDLNTDNATWNDISYKRSGNRLLLDSDDLHNAFPNLENNVTEYIQLTKNAKKAIKVVKDDSGSLKFHLKLKQ